MSARLAARAIWATVPDPSECVECTWITQVRSYASGMAAIESPETVGIRPFHEFDEAHALWPRGDRPAALREAAQEFRARFKQQGQIRGVRTIDLASAGYPTAFALAGAAKGLHPFVNNRHPLAVVQFEDFEADL